jgi:hypothetical protein
MADANEIRLGNTFQPAGFINTFLYGIVYGVNGSSKLYSQDFHDVTTGATVGRLSLDGTPRPDWALS